MGERGWETGKYGRFPDQALSALAADQHLVFGLEQLVRLGLSASAVHKRTATGRLHRVYSGVYSLVPPALLTREGRWLAAVLACGPDAVVSHRTAAALHGLRSSGAVKYEVTVPRRSPVTRAGINVHRSITLTAADVTTVRGIPATTVARTLLDLAGVIGRRQLERAFDQSEILEVFDLRQIEDQLARNAYRREAKTVRTVLQEHYIGSTPTWSELEEAFLALVRSAGVPLPEVNAFVNPHDGDRAIRADFVWRAQRVVVETDGHKFHGTRQARERDSRNAQRLVAANWLPVRATWRQIFREPARVARTLNTVLSGRSGPATGAGPG